MSALFRRQRASTDPGDNGFYAGDALPSIDASQPWLEREVARARRHERPLAVIVHRFDSEWRQASHLAAAIPSSMRITDLVTFDPERGRVVIFLPETDREQGEAVAARVRQWIENEIAVRVQVGVAVFPEDALVLMDVVTAAGNASALVGGTTIRANGEPERNPGGVA